MIVDYDRAQLRLECIDRALKAIMPDDGPAQVIAAAREIEAYLIGAGAATPPAAHACDAPALGV